jgi:penicillin-binding protein 1A
MTIRKVLHDIRSLVPISVVQKIFFGLLVVIGFLTGIFISQIVITFSDLKDISPLENYSRFSVPTKVYDSKGNLITEFFREKRELISFKDLPDDLVKAIISIEDNEFYHHSGFNPVSVFKGVFIDPLFGKRARGGSTLTQQLAKSLFTSGERSLFRKMIELWYAFQIEKKYSKEEILELYFNQVYFGHGCYGVQSAARYFFDKDVSDLNLAEASLLAGIVNAPEAFSPIFHPYRAQARHHQVLLAMVKQGYISRETAEDAYNWFWENYSSIIRAKDITAQRTDKNWAPYFTEWVRMQLVDKYGEDKLYSGGYQIYTSLDLDKQKAAQNEMMSAISNEQDNYDHETRGSANYYKEQYEDIIDMMGLYLGMDSLNIGYSRVRDRLDELLKRVDDPVYLTSFAFGLDGVNKKIRNRYFLNQLVKNSSDQVEGSLISINPQNGYIEAMVGGRSFNYANQYNRAIMARRQTGSLFKPFYYAMAIEKKLITPATVFDDKPMIYEDEAKNLWTPRNYDGKFMGPIRVRQALQNSINIVAIQIWDSLLKTFGYNNVIAFMADMFSISTDEAKKRVEDKLAYALGVGTFTPYELAYALTTFANGGTVMKPISILRVKDRYSRVVDDFEVVRDQDKNSRRQVLSPGAAYLMQSMMNTVLYNGTGADAAKETGFSLDAGGKTGTTPNWKDAWFGGFTRNLVTVVWFGFDDANKSLGKGRTGAVVAAVPWMRYMLEASKNLPNLPFPMPADVTEATVCARTGLLASPFCPNVTSEYFIRNTVPSKICDLHTTDNQGFDSDIQLQHITNQIKMDELELDKKKDNSSSGPDDGNLGDLKLDDLKIEKGLQ